MHVAYYIKHTRAVTCGTVCALLVGLSVYLAWSQYPKNPFRYT